MQCPAVRTPLVVAKLQAGPMGAVIPESRAQNPARQFHPPGSSKELQSNYGSNDAIAFRPLPPLSLSLSP